MGSGVPLGRRDRWPVALLPMRPAAGGRRSDAVDLPVEALADLAPEYREDESDYERGDRSDDSAGRRLAPGMVWMRRDRPRSVRVARITEVPGLAPAGDPGFWRQ
jgi:hypothetical protein